MDILDLLEKHGGWGVSVICIGAIIKLWNVITTKDAKIFDLLDKQNDILKFLQGGGPPKEPKP